MLNRLSPETTFIPLTYARCRKFTPGAAFEPHTVAINHADSEIKLQTVLRIVTGQRMVLKGQWQSREVIVKLFYHPWRARRSAAREVRGLQQLAACQISHPHMHYHGSSATDRRLWIVITEYLPAPTVQHYWQQLSTLHDKQTLLMRFVNLLNTLQHHQIHYNDSHFNNFLIQNDTLIVLDGAAVSHHRLPISEQNKIQQLASLLAQCDETFPKAMLLQFIRHYFANSARHHDEALLRQLQTNLRQEDQRRLSHKLKKYLRDCTAYRLLRTPYSQAIIDREYDTPELQQWLRDPDTVFQEQAYLKQGNSSSVIHSHFANQPVVIKRYNMKNTWHWLRRMFRQTRARHAWLSAHILTHFAIATPKPIALLEKRFLGLSSTSYFVYAYQEGICADVAFNNLGLREPQRKQMIHHLVVLINQLKDHQLLHGDLKASNFLITEDNTAILLDLDNLRWLPNQQHFLALHYQDQARFLRNWQYLPDLYDKFTHCFAVNSGFTEV